MAGDHYFVREAYLRALAREFQAAAGRLGALTGQLQSSAFEIGEAFGLLGACTGAASRYRSLAERTAHGLGEAERALSADSAGLAHTAERYVQVERRNAGLFDADLFGGR